MNANASAPTARPTPRLTADERRQAIVVAGMEEFAARGLAGASTDAIAQRAGVSQPYVFQLFGTKKELFLAVIRHGFDRTGIVMAEAGRRQTAGYIDGCNSILDAMGLAYMELLADRTLLLMQLQAYAACEDPDVQQVVREEFGRLYRTVRDLSGADDHEIHHFFAEGMLLNVAAAVGVKGSPMEWSLEDFGGGV